MKWFKELVNRKRAIQNRDAYCSFCAKHHATVGPLVEGPNDAYICGYCCRRLLSASDERSFAGHCSFCHQIATTTGAIYGSGSVEHICAECIELAQIILNQADRSGKGRDK